LALPAFLARLPRSLNYPSLDDVVHAAPVGAFWLLVASALAYVKILSFNRPRLQLGVLNFTPSKRLTPPE